MGRRPEKRFSGGQGVHREMESEGHEEKYRAVIDGGYPEDEPVGQRWGKVEPALWRRRRSHSPTSPRCVRTARYGRTACDLRRTGRVSGWHRSKRTYKRKRNGERGSVRSRRAEQNLKCDESCVTEGSATKSGSGKAAGEDGREGKGNQMSKDEGGRNSSFSEKPVRSRLRRLVDWINPTGAKKVHSLIDKVYKRKNLEMAWEKGKENRGSGGVDGQTLEAFETQLEQQLDRLQRELKEDTYRPLPVRQHPIPKRDKPGEYRMLGIPAIYDRVCQRRCSIGWSLSSSRYSMMPAWAIGEGDLRRMRCAKCGKRYRT